ncbi:MAG: SUMF1/EgtB/PvdO family nonheme iron enzyme, partial [Sedimentisphaerales bacterium]|nr:SUMF1/EgtB/PvdO family nonheme iron enzyme [Sedimentisphaerales bacterium]
LEALRSEALLANPLLTELPGLLVVKRKIKELEKEDVFTAIDMRIGYSAGPGRDIGMPSNHECNASLERDGYDNEICLLSPDAGKLALKTVYRPDAGGYVGELDLHFDGLRVLFTGSDAVNWKLYEMNVDGSHVRQLTQMPDDVDAMDGCYLPDGRIIFGSTASYQSVPCWHGRKRVSNLYLTDTDGTDIRQLCFDQDHDFHPVVLDSGKVLYLRWDYTGISHIYLRQLMTMNPDGTQQRAIYGSNSWYPNSLFFPRQIPGTNRLIAILSGYHGPHRMGQLVIIDPRKGWHEESGIVQRITGRGEPIKPLIRDDLVGGDWPMFLHPYPLSDTHFLVSCRMNAKSPWGIYLADTFDNLVLVYEEPGYALLEPTPILPRKQPMVIPDRVDLTRDDATVYIGDVYAGPGLKGVPRGVVRQLRLVGYDFGYRGLAGSDKIGYGGPWEVMRIIGTVPVENDGSASFVVPANTPVALQALDREGKAVQLMRSWFTAMPGEEISCVGCHETPMDVPGNTTNLAAKRPPRAVSPWYGPARGFDFEREVQPVLDEYCISCHDGSRIGVADLRSEADGGKAEPKPIGYVSRLHPDMLEATDGRLKYSPAYDVLIHYIRRVGIEDDVSLLTPGEYHADTSELIQMLQKGHHGVRLNAEALGRLITWIDLNGPCHGTWGDVFPIPDHAHERRMELRKLYGGPMDDYEKVLEPPSGKARAVPATAMSPPRPLEAKESPLAVRNQYEQQSPFTPARRRIDPEGVKLSLLHLPAGQFVMGDIDGQAGESPPRVVTMDKPVWMSECEITNAQFRRFDPSHDSGYYTKRRDRADGKGLSLNGDDQPVVRVSFEQAMDFCRWLSIRTGLTVALPTEQQWEYACRAGSATALNYGSVDDNFAPHANLADRTFSTGVMNATGRMMPEGGVTQATGGVPHLLLEGAKLADIRFDDGKRVTAPTGLYKPNHWGLFDMHGNAAEWTLSDYDDDRKVVRGGSFFNRPARSRSSFRLGYPTWRRVFNVGFRVVVIDANITATAAKGNQN